MSKPIITIIVPVYNTELLLARCIESIIDQDFIDFELLLVDDGSTDNSFVVCSEFAARDSRITVLKSNHKGVSGARNTGIEVARGRYVVFVDSDDWVKKNYLSDFFRQPFDQTKTTMVTQTINVYFNDGSSSRGLYYDEDKVIVDNFAEHIVANKILHNGFSVAKLLDLHLIKEKNIRFNEKLEMQEDHVFIFDYMMFTEQIVISCRHSYHYMIYDGNVTLSTRFHPAKMYLLISEMLMERLEKLIVKYELQSYKDSIDLMYSDMGLQQIVGAIRRVKPSEYGIVIDAFNKNEARFRNFTHKQKKTEQIVNHLLWLPRWARVCYLIFPNLKTAYKQMRGKPIRL